MALTEERRAELERKGARVTTVKEMLGLDDADMAIIEIKVRVAHEVRRRREAQGMTQAALARKMKVSQPRIPAIESGVSASLETLLHAFLAAGGTTENIADLLRQGGPSTVADITAKNPRKGNASIRKPKVLIEEKIGSKQVKAAKPAATIKPVAAKPVAAKPSGHGKAKAQAKKIPVS